jgi:hypothetical protein
MEAISRLRRMEARNMGNTIFNNLRCYGTLEQSNCIRQIEMKMDLKIISRTLLILTLFAYGQAVIPVQAVASEYRTETAVVSKNHEELLEKALLNRYYPLLKEAAKKQFFCTKILSIKRLDAEDDNTPRFDVTVQFVTFEGPHNPPYDLVKVTIRDTLYGARAIHVERKPNIRQEEFKQVCE